jgi:MFS family permease
MNRMSDPTSAVDRPSTIATCLVLATVGFVTSMGMPMVVEALIEQYGYSEGHAGYVASSEYLGMFAASVVVSSLILRVSRRKLAVAGIVIAALSNAVSLFATSLPDMLALRFMSGLGCGMAYAVAVAVLAGTSQIVRNFMFLVFANAVTNVLVLNSFPMVLERWHLAGIFIAYCGVLIGTAPAFLGCREGMRRQARPPRKRPHHRIRPHPPSCRGCACSPYSVSI